MTSIEKSMFTEDILMGILKLCSDMNAEAVMWNKQCRGLNYKVISGFNPRIISAYFETY